MLASHSAAASAPHASGGAKLVFSSQARRAAGVVARRAAPRQRLTVMAAAPAASGPQLMINSVTGKMGQAVAEAAVRAGVEVIPFSLCSPSEEGQTSVKVAGHSIELVGAKGRDEAIQRLKSQYPRLLMVDYTVPDVIHQQAATYIRNATPFVMGTTGGDRAKLLADVQAAGLYAVIAPQMGKQVVAFQATMEAMATSFPGAFSGYKLEVVESHQSTKKDTSGTAKAIVSSFERLGASFDGNIVMVRDKESQTRDMKARTRARGEPLAVTLRLSFSLLAACSVRIACVFRRS